MSCDLKGSLSLMELKWYGIAFHNFGPVTANELSYKDLFAAELYLYAEGTTARFPRRGLETNCTLISLLV